MRKLILFFTLSLIFLSLFALLFNSILLKKKINYDNNSTNVTTQSEEQSTDFKSTYTDYTQEAYDNSLNENKIIVLYFTSNWCLECQAQDDINSKIFDEFKSSQLTAFRVHILDSETTGETDALAKKFDITKEYSFVILDKNGAVYFKNTGLITEESLKEQIQKAGDLI